ncbi:ABC transporter ATP-binding protein [Alteromonas gracilis]
MITLDGVAHAYGDRQVLRDLTLSLPEQRIGVIGANGSGKSTFARLLNGLVVPDEGRVVIDDLDTARSGREVRRRVGFCFTDPDAQIVMPTVAEDVAFSLRRSPLSRPERARLVEETLAAYGLAGHADHPSHLLSGGQKQLLALASVLVTDPDVLVLDEPTTLLDLANARRFAERLDGLRQQVVLVSHDLDLVQERCERVLVFADGRVVHDGDPAAAVAAYREASA